MKRNGGRRGLVWRSVISAAALAASGCTNDSAVTDPPPVVERAALQAFSGANACQDLEKYLEDSAVMMMKSDLEAARDGVPGWGWWGGIGLRGGVEDFAAPQASAAGAAPKAAPQDYTTTNTQEAGVDEADFVKNDGTRIFVLSGDTLYASLSWPASQLSLQGKLKIEGWPREMFLADNNQLVVFSSVYEQYPLAPKGVACAGLWCGYSYETSVKTTVVDVSSLGSPQVVAEYYLPGQYFNSRRIGQSVRIVMRDDFRFPQSVKWYPDYSPGLWEDKARLKAAYNDLIAANETAIRAMTLSDWLPAGKAIVGGNTTTLSTDCQSFSRVNAPVRLGELTVATLNLNNPTQLNRTSVLAEAGEVYASSKNLYVATPHYFWWPAVGQTNTTYLHKFDITQPDKAIYVASGKVDGLIVDQFSLDENAAGDLRAATTITSRVASTDPNQWWGTTVTTNRVSVLREQNGSLDVVGKTADLADGERIQSARFFENQGYVVTYRNTDPLFTFDLSDSTNPRKVGELKVPGFSSYIHPLDAQHLITIGTYIPDPGTGTPNGNWQERRLQLAIFDVSDLTQPKQTHVQFVGSAYTWSEAQWEHKAFNYFAAKKLLAIPFADYSWGSTGDTYWSAFVSDLRVFSVDPVTGFTPRGAVGMKDLYQWQNYNYWSWYWEPSVRRSVMADDFVYAISDAGIRVANIADLSTALATVKFDRYQGQ